MFRDGMVKELLDYYEKNYKRLDQKSIDGWMEEDLQIFDFCKDVIDAFFDNQGSTKTVRIARNYGEWSQKITLDFDGEGASFDYTKRTVITTGSYGTITFGDIRPTLHSLIYSVAVQHEWFIDKWIQAYIEHRFDKKYASADNFQLEMTE